MPAWRTGSVLNRLHSPSTKSHSKWVRQSPCVTGSGALARGHYLYFHKTPATFHPLRISENYAGYRLVPLGSLRKGTPRIWLTQAVSIPDEPWLMNCTIMLSMHSDDVKCVPCGIATTRLWERLWAACSAQEGGV